MIIIGSRITEKGSGSMCDTNLTPFSIHEGINDNYSMSAKLLPTLRLLTGLRVLVIVGCISDSVIHQNPRIIQMINVNGA